MFATLELPLRDDSRHKRLKVGRACHPCRMKKIKCDGKQPCMQCKARRRKCMYLKNPDETYIRLDAVNKSSSTDTITDFVQSSQPVLQQQQQQQQQQHEKIFASDSLFATHQPTSDSHTITTTRPDKMIEQLTDGLVRLTLHQDASKLGHEHVTPWRSYGDFIRWTPEPSLPTFYTSSIDMPSRNTQGQLISIFFDEYHHILPILSKSMFYEQLKTKGSLVTPLLLNIIYAHAAKHMDSNEADLFYGRARRLVDDFLDVPRISTVIALLYMALYNFGHSHSSRAWMYSGMAIRMCLELGLHTANYSSQMSQFDIELRKRVLWACYVLDKIESCIMERPWMLKSKDIALDFPSPLPEDSPQERLVLEGFNQLCRLMILIEKVIHFFTYDMKNLNLWSISEENQILQYLDAIHQWRDMLPNDLKWTTPASSPGMQTCVPPVPSLFIVANLHLVCYDLELSLLMCCRYQDENLHRQRRRTLANTITHIVSLIAQHKHLMYNFAFSAFSGIFAALTHAMDFEHQRLDISENAKTQFRKGLEDIRRFAERIHIRDLPNFIRLVDLTLQLKSNNNNNNNNNNNLLSVPYASTFALSDMIQNDTHSQRNGSMSPIDLYSDMLDSSSGYVTPERQSSPFSCNYMISGQFAFDVFNQQASTVHSSPTLSVSAQTAAAVTAAAAAVGAVDMPVSMTDPQRKSLEPADYTFGLISVDDEWAKSFIY